MGTARATRLTCQCLHTSIWGTIPVQQRSWRAGMAAGTADTGTTTAQAAAAAWAAAGTEARAACST